MSSKQEEWQNQFKTQILLSYIFFSKISRVQDRGDSTIKEIENARSLAHRNHLESLAFFKMRAEHNCLFAELEGSRHMIDIERRKLQLLSNHEINMLKAEVEIKLAQQNSKQLEAGYKLDIETAARLEAFTIEQLAIRKSVQIEAETEADSNRIKKIGLARVYAVGSEHLAQARRMKHIAMELVRYNRAIVIDKLAGYILRAIADKLQLDPQFRFKLEKPLSFRILRSLPITRTVQLEYQAKRVDKQ